MPQDDRKGQPPSTRGRAPAPGAPGTPDTRDIKAPPPPEAPETQEAAADEPPARPSVPMSGDGVTDQEAGEHPEESESDRLRREIGEAEKALEAKKAELARAEERRKTEEATAKMVADYSQEVPALTATEGGLRQYRLAETSFLSKFLDAATMQNIADASARAQSEIDELAAKVGADARAAAEKRAELDAAKEKALAAKARAEALKRPAASIRDRLKAADAISAEAKKASDAGNYALAHWLIMDGGRLDEKVRAEPRIIPASELEAAVRQSAADQTAANEEVTTLEGELRTLEAGLQADQAKLAALKVKFDATVRDTIAQFNPRSAEAA